MSLRNVVVTLGILIVISATGFGNHHECPDGVCRPVCDEGEVEEGRCCKNRKCCVPACVEREGCMCRHRCSSFTKENGTCTCEDQLCCLPCVEQHICEEIGSCKETCDTGETVFEECCTGGGQCCIPCGTCTGSDVQCQLGATSCPDGENNLGGCCQDDGEGGFTDGICCSSTELPYHQQQLMQKGDQIVKPCSGAFREGSSVLFTCQLASDESCGSSTGGSVNTGYCPTNKIKCCPVCGWDCFHKHGGKSCRQNNQCVNKIDVMDDDCCSPAQCCGDQ